MRYSTATTSPSKPRSRKSTVSKPKSRKSTVRTEKEASTATTPFSPFLRHAPAFIEMLKKLSPHKLVRSISDHAPEHLSQTRSLSSYVSYALTTPVETTHGTRTAVGAETHAAILWMVCCRTSWAAKLSSAWLELTNAPVRYLCFIGLTIRYLNPPVTRWDAWDARYIAHKTNRFLQSLNETIGK